MAGGTRRARDLSLPRPSGTPARVLSLKHGPLDGRHSFQKATLAQYYTPTKREQNDAPHIFHHRDEVSTIVSTAHKDAEAA